MEQSPWLLKPEAIAGDFDLQTLRHSSIRRDPQPLADLDLEESQVTVLRGPRRVGKTTALKLLVERAIGQGFHNRVIYFSFDLDRKADHIVEVAKAARELFPQVRGPRIFLFDEIGAVPDWQNAIKYLRDQTACRNDCFVLTGSSARDLKGGAERLPGRRGKGRRPNRVILPMSFPEFLRALDYRDPCPVQARLAGIAKGERDRELREGAARVSDLRPRLDAYLDIGGFPQAVEAYQAGRREGIAGFVRELWDVVAQEIDRVGRDRATAIRILERVNSSLGSSMSWTKLAEDIGVASAATAEQYAGALTDAFLLLPLYSLDRHKRRAALRKQKKLYVLDPAVAAIPPAVRPGSRTAPQPALLESAVAAALYATEETEILESVGFPQNIYYWRSTKDREVDFVVLEGSSETAVEVKTTPTGHDRARIRKAFGSGIIISRGVLDLDDPVKIIPAELILWALDPAHS